MNTHVHTRPPAPMYAHGYTRARPCVRPQARVSMPADTHRRTYAHTRTHLRTHTQARTRIHAHSRTRAHDTHARHKNNFRL